MEIVLAYSGHKWPRYLEANLKYLKKAFPSQHVVLLSDNSLFPHRFREYAECISIEHKSERMYEFFSNLNHSKDFWDGFWFKTIERFFLLESYLSDRPGQSILHLEADVLLLNNFPFEKFEDLEHGLAFPMISDTQGVASVLFIRDLDSLRDFLTFAYGVSITDSTATDMSLLAQYAKHSQDVLILPSIPRNYAAPERNSILFKLSQLMEDSKFDCLFDGATYGQYLFGIDPRNNLGNRKLFSTFPNHFVNPSNLEFNIDGRNSNLGIKLAGDLDYLTTICCLHIHSKDLRAFQVSPICANDLLVRRVNQTKLKKEISEFVPSFLLTESRFIFRAILRKSTNFVRNFFRDLYNS